METRLRFSVVVTVRNEGGSITPLLDSLWEQTLKPDEIIVVDAGSTDKTVELIDRWKDTHKIALHLFELTGANRSEGRNFGIRKAKNEYIAITDAGCVAHNDWLAKLAQVYTHNKETETVAGFYEMESIPLWQKVFRYYLGILPDRIDPNTYLPSSRSLALTKIAFEKSGGYPEHLETCEDLVFARNLKTKTKMKVAAKAKVDWQMPKDLGQFFSQVAGYAKGDVEARYWPHLYKHILIWFRYGLFLILPWLFVVYLFYPWFKWRRYTHSIMEVLLVAVVQVVSDLAVMVGGIRGLARWWVRA